jgi:hypothetical protein
MRGDTDGTDVRSIGLSCSPFGLSLDLVSPPQLVPVPAHAPFSILAKTYLLVSFSPLYPIILLAT